jgi:hypothetical protein
MCVVDSLSGLHVYAEHCSPGNGKEASPDYDDAYQQDDEHEQGQEKLLEVHFENEQDQQGERS